MRWTRSLALALILIALLGCAAPPPPEPEPSPEATAEPTATPEPSPTPAPTATAIPDTPTPSPSPTVTSTPEPEPEPERVRVSGTGGQGANLREEPGSQGRALKVLREGAELTVVGPDRDADGRPWRNVRDAEDTVGWVIAEALTPIAPTATASPASEPPAGPTAAAGPIDASAPCRPGQLKGDATSGLYYRPTHSEYSAIRERVRCFDAESQARASGFRPAP